MKQQTTQWVVDNWEWVIPLEKNFLESLPTHLIIQQLKTTSKIIISDRENIPKLEHIVIQDGRNCRVRLVFMSEDIPIQIQEKSVEKIIEPKRKEFEYIDREDEIYKWLGGTIKVIKCNYNFELNKLEWYHYVVKRHSGRIIEKSFSRGVSRRHVDERIAYYQSIDEERMKEIRDALDLMEMEA